jgi:hypothetical protein
MHVARRAIALCALSVSLSVPRLVAQDTDPKDIDTERHQVLRANICSKLDVLRPDVQTGITIAVTDDAIIIDGVRDSSIKTVAELLRPSMFIQELRINGHAYHAHEQAMGDPEPNSNFVYNPHWAVIGLALDPAARIKHRSPIDIGSHLEFFFPMVEASADRFPWPPPEASAVFELPRHERSLNVADQVNEIRANLRDAGYQFSRIFRLPGGGAAVVAPIEQIDAQGNPMPDSARWATGIRPLVPLSVVGYLKALFAGRQAYWRVIVFVITDQPLPFGKLPTMPDMDAMRRFGSLSLASTELKEKLTSEHHVWAYIYEITARESDAQPTVVLPGRFSGEEHLRKARLIRR